jgi:ribosomal protein L7/L12
MDARQLKFVVKGILDIGKAQSLAEVHATQRMLVRYLEMECLTDKLEPDTITIKMVPTPTCQNKIHVIKEIRGFTGLGLKESKDLCELGGMLPKPFDYDTALRFKAEMDRVGMRLEFIGASEMFKVLHGD